MELDACAVMHARKRRKLNISLYHYRGFYFLLMLSMQWLCSFGISFDIVS